MSSPSADPFVASQDARAPQMRDYDALEAVLHPYLGFTAPSNLRRPSVSTDSFGFRRSEFGGRVVSTESLPEEGYGLALGSSFMFGVGATHDRHSVVSQLAELSGKPFANRAVRAGNSLQEFLAALPLLDRTEDVVVCSGVNNLAVAFWSTRTYDDLGPLFNDEWIALLAGRRLEELAALVGGAGLGPALRTGLAASRARLRRGGDPRPPLDPEAITSSAANRQLRDLRLAVAAARRATTVHFILQPFVVGGRPELRPEAPRPVDRRAREWWSSTLEFAEEHWDAYTEKLRAGCRRAGVPCGVLDAAAFEGRAFVDRVHMTDHGQRQAAGKILEMMRVGAA